MSYIIEVLPDEPIILMDVADFNVVKDLQPYFDEILALLEAQTEKVALITDARHIKITFSDIVEGLAKITQGNILASHPNTGQIIVVSGSVLSRMAAKALSQSQYGGVSVLIFETVEEALAAARAG